MAFVVFERKASHFAGQSPRSFTNHISAAATFDTRKGAQAVIDDFNKAIADTAAAAKKAKVVLRPEFDFVIFQEM